MSEPANAAGASFTVVRGGEVFAPTPLGGKDILISGERILDIGDDLEEKCRALGPVKIIDARGRSVVPGFIDQHIHFLGGGDAHGPLGRVPELHASWITTGGVTTAVGVLGVDMDSKNLHALLVKARELDCIGLSTYIYTGSFKVPSPYLTSSVRADISLIDKVVGCKVALAEDTCPNLSLNNLADLAGDLIIANRFSRKAAVMHCHIGRNQRRMEPIFDLLEKVNIPIRQITPTHVNFREPYTLEHGIRFAKMGGVIDFTAIMSKRSGIAPAMDPDEAVQRSLDAGVVLDQITLSSDANVGLPEYCCCGEIAGYRAVSPGVLHREWMHIVRTNKLSLEQALPLVTTNVARGLKIDDKKGALKPGLDADIVFLRDDLVVDTVICRGKVMVEGCRAVVKGPFEEHDTADLDPSYLARRYPVTN
jgi:beta-aspartyl-dipeptidase (metallo-type)